MSIQPTRGAWIEIYKQLIGAAKTLPNYSNRKFFLRRVRDYFRQNRAVDNPSLQQQLYLNAKETLAFLKRERVQEEQRQQPNSIFEKCRGSDYNNKNFTLLINECAHALCKTCVDSVFVRMSAPCPTCGRVLKKNTFWPMQFEDARVEVEVYFRKKLQKIYNLKEDDFDTLKEYNDYLESVEQVIFNLVENERVDETKTAIANFAKENEQRIQKNRGRLSKDECWIQEMLNADKEMHERQSAFLNEEISTIQAEAQTLRANANAVIADLMHADVPADVIVNAKRHQAMQEECVEKEKKPKVRNANKVPPSVQLCMSEGEPFKYTDVNVPNMPLTNRQMERLLSTLRRQPSLNVVHLASGLSKTTCSKRIIDAALCDLFHGCCVDFCVDEKH